MSLDLRARKHVEDEGSCFTTRPAAQNNHLRSLSTPRSTQHHQAGLSSDVRGNRSAQAQVQSLVSPMCRTGPSSELESLGPPSQSSPSSSRSTAHPITGPFPISKDKRRGIANNTKNKNNNNNDNYSHHLSPHLPRWPSTSLSSIQSHPQSIFLHPKTCLCACICRSIDSGSSPSDRPSITTSLHPSTSTPTNRSSSSLSSYSSHSLYPPTRVSLSHPRLPSSLKLSISNKRTGRTRGWPSSAIFLVPLLGLSSSSCAPSQVTPKSKHTRHAVVDQQRSIQHSHSSQNQDQHLPRSIPQSSQIVTQTNPYLDPSPPITFPIDHASKHTMDNNPCLLHSSPDCRSDANQSSSNHRLGKQSKSDPKPATKATRDPNSHRASSGLVSKSHISASSSTLSQLNLSPSSDQNSQEPFTEEEPAIDQHEHSAHPPPDSINPKSPIPTYYENVDGHWVLSDNWNLYGLSGPTQRHRPRSLAETNSPSAPINQLNASSTAAHHSALTGEIVSQYDLSPLSAGPQVVNSTNNGTKLYLPAGWNHTSPRGPLYVVPAIVVSSLFLALSVVGTVVFLVARRRAARNRARKALAAQHGDGDSANPSIKDEEGAMEMVEDQFADRRRPIRQRLKTLTVVKILKRAGGKEEARIRRIPTIHSSGLSPPSVIVIEEAHQNSRVSTTRSSGRIVRRRSSRRSSVRSHVEHDQITTALEMSAPQNPPLMPILPESQPLSEAIPLSSDHSHGTSSQSLFSSVNTPETGSSSISHGVSSVSTVNPSPSCSLSTFSPYSGAPGNSDHAGSVRAPIHQSSSRSLANNQLTEHASTISGESAVDLAAPNSTYRPASPNRREGHGRAYSQRLNHGSDSQQAFQTRSRCSTLPAGGLPLHHSVASPPSTAASRNESIQQSEPSRMILNENGIFSEPPMAYHQEPPQVRFRDSGEGIPVQAGLLPPAYYSGRHSEDSDAAAQGRFSEKQRAAPVEEEDMVSDNLQNSSQLEGLVAHVATDDKHVLGRLAEMGSTPSGTMASGSNSVFPNLTEEQGRFTTEPSHPSAPPLVWDDEGFEPHACLTEPSRSEITPTGEGTSRDAAGSSRLLPPPPGEFIINFNPNLPEPETSATLAAATSDMSMKYDQKDLMMTILPSAPPQAEDSLPERGSVICTAPPYWE